MLIVTVHFALEDLSRLAGEAERAVREHEGHSFTDEIGTPDPN